MARPSKYNYDICVEICEQISLGANAVLIIEGNSKYPTFPTFCKWKRENDELFKLYASSHQDKAVFMESEIDIYRDMLLSKEIDAPTYNVLVQTLKWKMAKFYPKVFGDKQAVDVTTNGSSLFTGTVVIRSQGIMPEVTYNGE